MLHVALPPKPKAMASKTKAMAVAGESHNQAAEMINEAVEENQALSKAVEAEDGCAQEAAVSQTTNKRKAK